MAADNIRTSILIAASHPTNNSAATTFTQAAAALQEVLTERRVLETIFLADLNLSEAALKTELSGALVSDLNPRLRQDRRSRRGTRQRGDHADSLCSWGI